MDLGGWNFDPSMLSSLAWSDNNTEHGEKNTKKKTTEASPTGSLPAHLDSRNWVGNLALLSNFGDQEYEGAICSQRAMSSYIDRDDRNASQTAQAMETDTIVTQSKPQSEASASIHTVSDAQSMNSGSRDSGTSSVASRATSQTSSMSSSAGGPQLHPMAIQSSATCPPHSSASGTGDSSNVVRANQYLHLSTGRMPIGQNHQASSDSFGLHGIDSAALASLAAAFQNPSAQSNNHISSLAANFMLAHAKPADTEKVCLDSTRQLGSTTRSHSFSGSSTSAAPTVASSVQQSRQHSKQSSTKPPPFYLFDAPIELRANFMQNQRKLGLPIQHDPNSYHYGETVKGFHPQNLMNQEQVMDVAANTQANQIQEAPVQLIDARHGNLRPSFSGRVKNEREQKRAQKITELIDQLRIDMERGGCKVEMRSKFHTLSQCADYVKQLIKSTEEKEEAINRLKSDIDIKKRKIEEEKSAQESRSDPESVISSLTSDTGPSLCHSRPKQPPSKKVKKERDHKETGIPHQGNTASSHNMSSISSNEDSSGGGEDRASMGSGARSIARSGAPSAQGLSTDKTDVTGLSDLTDSNRASSSNNSGSEANSGKTESVHHAPIEGNCEQFLTSTSSISSDAAVASEKSSSDCQSGEHHHNHKDVVFNNHGSGQHRKRPTEETTSLEPCFGLNYEEVFSMSNVPQLIATTSGKIVTWNKCFLKVTGIRRSEIKRMTIFSLVRPEMLSSFFEIVAHALKPELSAISTRTTASEGSSIEKTNSEEALASTLTRMNYAAMTLPCCEFPFMKKRRAKDSSCNSDQLFVTVTLMADEDPRKRCFHCVFTNCPGTNGALGIITSGLLASLFAAPELRHKKARRHHLRSQNNYKGSVPEDKMSSVQAKNNVNIGEALPTGDQTEAEETKCVASESNIMHETNQDHTKELQGCVGKLSIL